MSIEAIDETFEALAGGLAVKLTCDVHGEEHNAGWFFESKCPACAWKSYTAVCDQKYYETVANKEKKIVECLGCHNSFKPFEIIETARRVH